MYNNIKNLIFLVSAFFDFGTSQEYRWLQTVFIAQIGDRYPVNQMPFQDDYFFVILVVFTMFAHDEFLRFCTLTQTFEFSNSR